MQTCDYEDIPLRSRYYQGVIDLHIMERGAKYSELKPSFIIFICLNDPFNNNLPVYTFENICRQDNSIKLKDGAYKIFLNSKGSTEFVSDEMKDFFNLLNGKIVSDNYTLAHNLEKAVDEAKEHYMWREEYKSMINLLDFERMEAIEEGIKLGFENEMIYLLKQGKTPKEIADFTGHDIDIILEIARKMNN